MSKIPWLIISIISLILATSCRKTPSYVIPPDDMASLMADMRIADAVSSIRSAEYSTSAKRLALKNAVLERHGVTQHDLDTSLIYYGHNIALYQDVTQASIDILEERLKRINAETTGVSSVSAAGDSVDLWPFPAAILVNEKSPSQYFTMALKTDDNFERGDSYTLRAFPRNSNNGLRWNITATYTDGTVEYITHFVNPGTTGLQTLSLVSDSTRTPRRLSAWIELTPVKGHPAILDSVSLTRRHLTQGPHPRRSNLQRRITPPLNPHDSVKSQMVR